MWLNEHEQVLRRDLQGLASDLRWSAVELLRIAEQLRLTGNDVDAEAVKRLCDLFQGDEQRLVRLCRRSESQDHQSKQGCLAGVRP